MKLFMVFAISAMAILSSVSAQAGVVLLSNMGDSGLQDTASGVQSDITNAISHAAGFTTGPVAHELSWASLVGEFIGAPGIRTISIYSSVVSGPNNSDPEIPFQLLYTSQGVFVDTKAVYTFGFNAGTILDANTTYWIVPESGLAWFHSTAGAPTERNSSGFSYVGGREKSPDTNNLWLDSGSNFTLSLAVPEPALTSFLCLGGIALIRRRGKK